jgi:Acetyltransferases
VITISPTDDLTVVRELITEYTNSLGVDLSFQDLDHELDTLAQFYEQIFVAREDNRAAGCVALRRIDDTTCEMKRLYIRPEFRGHDLGRHLAEHVINEARQRGYQRMRLDTLPSMTAAIPLYQSLGFVEIAPIDSTSSKARGSWSWRCNSWERGRLARTDVEQTVRRRQTRRSSGTEWRRAVRSTALSGCGNDSLEMSPLRGLNIRANNFPRLTPWAT